MKNMDSDFPADLQPVAELLEEQRPRATALQLDQVESQVKARAGRETASRRRRAGFMRPRLALTAMLTVGLLMSGAGASLAISGISGSGNASVSQYFVGTTPPPGGTTPGTEVPSGGVQNEQASSPQDTNGAGNTSPGNTSPEDTVKVVDQTATGGGDKNLPFTGYAALPILLGGLALFAGGLVLRRREMRSTER